MKPWLRLLIFLILAAAFAAGACLLVNRLVSKDGHEDPAESHYWIHQQLHITAEQDRALDPVEQKFKQERDRLAGVIQDGNRELAEAIRTDKADSPKVREAVAKIHQSQGDLQNAVLQHVFDMRAYLTPEQYERLVQLTADALKRAPASN
jgi:Spy/CpxP family protein refolding chaperone